MTMAPALDTNRCAQYRRRNARCRACRDACPRKAVAIDDRGVVIDTGRCTICGLCSAVCPNEALSGAGDDLARAIPRLAARDEPVLGCSQHLASSGDARIACFGGLSAGDLVALVLAVKRPLVINIAACRGCPAGGDVVPVLQRRLADIRANVDWPPGVSVGMRTSFGSGPEGPVGASRRGFLQLFGRFVPPAAALPDSDPDRGTRAGRIRRAAAGLPAAAAAWLIAGVDHVPVKLAACDDCGRCARACPTSALSRRRIEGRKVLDIDAAACTGCGVCLDICPRGGIAVRSGGTAAALSADAS